MNNILKGIVTAGLLVFLAPSVNAVAVDLSTWTALDLNFPLAQGGSNWELQAGNTTVIQRNNSDPSFYLNNINQTSYSIDGTWQVLAPASSFNDDDYMGFVFGYQNSSNFYLFDWKQATQTYVSAVANEGMTIKKFTGATGDGLADLSLAELWANGASFGDMTILDKNQSSTKGWEDTLLYDFHLDFNVVDEQFRLIIKQGATTLWDVTINDATFTAGQFGFYNFSQENVRYAGFVQTGGGPPGGGPPGSDVSEPATVALLGVGLVGIGLVRRRNKVLLTRAM